ncbi:unnamed protein product [Dicrocoelium dendriticum]|nr:unnamed protein product [Dicrocoelium dendriticum]
MSCSIFILAILLVAAGTIQAIRQDYPHCDDECKEYKDSTDANCGKESGTLHCIGLSNAYYDCYYGCVNKALESKREELKKAQRKKNATNHI